MNFRFSGAFTGDYEDHIYISIMQIVNYPSTGWLERHTVCHLFIGCLHTDKCRSGSVPYTLLEQKI